MSDSSDEATSPIFPVLDRDTPVANRVKDGGPIREAVSNLTGDEEDDRAEALADAVVEGMSFDDEDEQAQFGMDFANSFARQLSGKLGVDADEINTDYLHEAMGLVVMDEETVMDYGKDEGEQESPDEDGGDEEDSNDT